MNSTLIEEPFFPTLTPNHCVNSSTDRINLPTGNYQRSDIDKFERDSSDNIFNSQSISQAQERIGQAENLKPIRRDLESEDESKGNIHFNNLMATFANKKKNMGPINELSYRKDASDDDLSNFKRVLEAQQKEIRDPIEGLEEALENRDNNHIFIPQYAKAGEFSGGESLRDILCYLDLSEVRDSHERNRETEEEIRCMQIFKRFIGKMNIKLETPNEVKQAYTTLLKMLKMIQKLYPDSKNKEDRIISLFKEKLTKPFVWIKSFLLKWDRIIKFMNAEEKFGREWQHQDHKSSRFKIAQEEFIKEWGQQTKSFDFENVEKALNYLRVCNDLNLAESEYAGLLDHLQISIQEYSQCVRDRMNNCFSTITNWQTGNIKDLQRDIERLRRALEDILIIKNKFTQFYSRFDNNREIIQTWKHNLTRCFIQQTNELKNVPSQALNQRLIVIKSLSQLDSFLDQEKFNDVYVHYQNLRHTTESNEYDEFKKAMKNNDYEQIEKNLSKDNLKMHQREIRDKLNWQLKILLEDTKRKVRFLPLEEDIVPEKIEAIVHNQKKIEQAKDLPTYLSIYEEVDLCIKEIKQNLNEKEQKILKFIDELVSNHNFYEAETKIARMISFWDIIYKPDVSAQLQKIEKSIQKTLKDLVTTYPARDFKDYVIISPKYLYNNLEKVLHQRNIYHTSFISLKSKFVERLTKELEEAKGSLDVNNIHIKSVESILSCLPDEIKGFITVKLEECRNFILQDLEKHDNKISIVLQSQNPIRISLLAQTCIEQNLKASTQKIQNFILEKMRDIQRNMTIALEQKDIKTIFSNMRELCEYNIHLQSFHEEISQLYLCLQQSIGELFAEEFSQLLRRISVRELSIIIGDSTQITDNNLQFVILFVCIAKKHEDQPFYSGMKKNLQRNLRTLGENFIERHFTTENIEKISSIDSNFYADFGIKSIKVFIIEDVSRFLGISINEKIKKEKN